MGKCRLKHSRWGKQRDGMSMSDIQALYGEVKFRVDYVFKGQPAVRAIFETRARSSFVSLTFVDDRLIEAEDFRHHSRLVCRGRTVVASAKSVRLYVPFYK